MPFSYLTETQLTELSLTELKGVGDKVADKLNRLGLESPKDLLFFFPFRYQNRCYLTPFSQLVVESEALVKGHISALPDYTPSRQRFKKTFLCEIQDNENRRLRLRFFNFSSYQIQRYQIGAQVVCYGTISFGPIGLEMHHPEVSFIEDEEDIKLEYRCIYHTTDGLAQSTILKLVHQVLSIFNTSDDMELLPAETVDYLKLSSFKESIQFLHQPQININFSALQDKQSRYHQRLIIEELVANQISVLEKSFSQKNEQASFQISHQENPIQQQFLTQLQFNLTSAQYRVNDEISLDMTQSQPMHRLVQGDVGSGKTIVAAMAILHAIEADFQACLMAPTELLAEQLFQNLSLWFEPLSISVSLLTGKTKGKNRKELLAQIEQGECQVLVGTHAVFQEHVAFAKLGLVVIDEQHRFGVHQRFLLRDKGVNQEQKESCSPHVLVMTATPIPRTLSMTAYADLSCSIIDELPPGRQAIDTVLIPQARREKVIERIYQACQQGKQAYWICTLVEESEVLQCQAAETTFNELHESLKEIKVALVHGQMKATEKLEIMSQFKQGEIQLLIATTVVEVGVDVPNASLMIIENAERLGLSQLHQLRGRVGRGSVKSACVLLYSEKLSEVGKKRLKIMRETQDGFVIAEEDLKLRGPGEILGTRQTGYQKMKIADLMRDQHLIPEAQNIAIKMLKHSPENSKQLMQRWLGDVKQYQNI
ncbi:MAG: ATP-dependent DNA helicase RecG [Gammaproteobacteria bacterium]|nr:ATP-dependent DNA helicase RecG [Gammaproteobacteria bacterium]